VTPPRSTLAGRVVAARPLFVFAAVIALVAGCISGQSDQTQTPAPSASAVSPAPSEAPSSPTLQPSPSSSPTEVPTASPTASESPSGAPASLPAEQAVEACAGNDENRTFFLQASEDLDWPVYCPILPARWFVSNGTYSGRGVGQLEIGYHGPGGATLTLQEGGFCETSDGCVPSGTESGNAAFGDQSGTLMTLDDGGYAIVVGRAQTPSWLAVGVGLDEAAFRQIAAGFVRLD
jgi:hypothetical protein